MMNYQPKHLSIAGKKATYFELNKEGTPAHFYPANGFPVGTYDSLLSLLSDQFQLTSLAMRACWEDIGPSKKQTGFEIYARDLAEFIRKHYNSPIIGIGHSQGATCSLMVAAQYPELFKALILIEPASLAWPLSLAMKYIPYYFKKQQEPFKGTLNKPDIWDSKADYFNYCRQSRIYKRVNDQVLAEIVEHSLVATAQGNYRLVFPVAWEVANYAMPPNVVPLIRKIEIPIQVIAGKPNVFFTQNLRATWEANAKNYSIQIFNDFGHLLPLEAPTLCAEQIMA